MKSHLPALGLLAPACLAVGAITVAPIAVAEEFEEIVVTARRQATPVLATPFSIGRVEAESLALVGATHGSEVLNRVPGALIQRGSGQESLTAVRSPVLTGAGSCGSFVFLENGVPIRPVGFCNVNEMLEINTEQAEALEILRGPGGALYGSNSVHGTINVLQPAPSHGTPASVELEGGPADYGRLGFTAARVFDRGGGGANLQALYAHDGGWRDESGYDEAKLNAAIEGSAVGRFDLAATWLDQETAGFITGKDAYRDEDLRETNPNPEAFRKAHAVRITGLVQPQTSLRGRLELRPYLRTSRMEFLQHFLLGQPLERNGQESAGVMTSVDWTLGERNTLLTGIDLEWADSFLLEDQDGPTTGGTPAANAIRPAGRHYDYTVTSNVAAAYAQYERELSRGLYVGAGLRLEYVAYDYDNRMLAGNTDENGAPCVPTACLYSRPADRRDTFTNAAPKLSLRWEPRPGLVLYANAARGFRPPEMTELYRLQRDQSVAALDSEQADALELGTKAALGDWHVEVAAFDMDKKDLILRESNGFYVGNGRTSHQGVEYQVAWQAMPTLSASIGGTYARHRYEFSRAVEGGENIVSGDDVDTAPRDLLRGALQWRPTDRIAAEAEWLMVGDYFADASNDHTYPGHEVLNLRARWVFTSQWSASVRVNNALDRDYADRADFAFGTYRYFPGRPRSVFAEIRWAAK
jgi:iron complex outermembrane receptor protein